MATSSPCFVIGDAGASPFSFSFSLPLPPRISLSLPPAFSNFNLNFSALAKCFSSFLLCLSSLLSFPFFSLLLASSASASILSTSRLAHSLSLASMTFCLASACSFILFCASASLASTLAFVGQRFLRSSIHALISAFELSDMVWPLYSICNAPPAEAGAASSSMSASESESEPYASRPEGVRPR